MTKPRSTSQIITAAKDCLNVVNGPGEPEEKREALSTRLIDILEIATRMDARTGTVDPSAKKPAKRKAVQLPIPGTEQ